jgi:opacity protein-like surface antigen
MDRGCWWMFAPAWSVKAEYLYVDLGNQSNTNTGFNSTITSKVNERDNIVRAGVNYRSSGERLDIRIHGIGEHCD